VLRATPTVRQKIREGEDADLPAIVNQHEEGMQSFNHHLAELVNKEWIEKRVAMEYSPNRDALDSALKGLQVKSATLVSRLKGSGGH
jgi:Tfp pilus assembly pilus retraction ATPase PilT